MSVIKAQKSGKLLDYFSRNKQYINHTYRQILTVLILFGVFSCLFFAAYMNRTLMKRQQKSEQDSYLQQLSQTSNELETIFTVLHQNIQYTVSDSSVISLLVNPESQTRNKILTLTSLLRSNIEGNQLLSNAWIYSPYSDIIYSDKGTYVPLSASANQKVIQEYLNEYDQLQELRCESNWIVMNCKDSLYLIEDVCTPNLIGIVFYRINSTTFSQVLQLNSQQDGSSSIYIYDMLGNALLPSTDAGIDSSLLTDSGNFITADSTSTRASYYRVDSDTTGLIYLAAIPGKSILGSWAGILAAMLPVLLLYILICILVSVVISRQIYAPVHQLLDMALRKTPPEDPDQSGQPRQRDMDILKNTFSESLSRNEQYGRLLTDISHEVLEQRIRKVLFYGEYKEEELQTMLQELGHAEMLHSLFMVFLCHLREDPSGRSFSLEKHIAYQEIYRDLVSSRPENTEMFIYRHSDTNLVMVLSFSESFDAVQAKRLGDSLYNQLTSQGISFTYPYRIWQGPLCRGMEHLGLAYQNACEADRSSRQTASPAADPLPSKSAVASRRSPKDMSSADDNPHVYKKRADLCIKYALQGDRDHTLQLLSDLMQMIFREENNASLMKEAALESAKMIRDQLLRLSLTEEDQQTVEALSAELQVIRSLEDSEEIRPRITTVCRNMLEMILQMGTRSTFRYVEEAKQYVTEHFSDVNLSLNDISTAVGISPHYMSRLFTEETGDTFITYLSRCRIEEARHLLSDTDLSMKEICAHCGFSSVQNFGRVFKKYSGLTPGQYRSGTQGGTT